MGLEPLSLEPRIGSVVTIAFDGYRSEPNEWRSVDNRNAVLALDDLWNYRCRIGGVGQRDRRTTFARPVVPQTLVRAACATRLEFGDILVGELVIVAETDYDFDDSATRESDSRIW